MSRKKTLLHFALTAATGLFAAMFTLHLGEVLGALRLPFLFPPVWLLPFGWTAALVLLVWAVTKACAPGTAHAKLKTAFYVSLALTFLWAFVFFRLDMKTAAVVVGFLLTGVLLHAMRLAKPVSELSAKLLLPCVIWSGFMTYLNLGICLLN